MLNRFTLLTLFLSACSFAQPKLVIEGGNRFDYGNLYTGQTAKHTVELKNEGTDTLIVSEVSASCGCTGTLLSNDHILPGESGALEISFDSKRFNGHIEKIISFKTNDPSQNKVRITFTAMITKILDVEPSYVMFGRMPDDSVASVDLTIDNDSDKKVKLISVTTSSDDVTVKASEMSIDSGDDVILKCTFASSSGGAHHGTIEIHTDHPKVPVLYVRYFALVVSRSSSQSR